MEDMNCCTECGFTTANLNVFTTHIEQHEVDARKVATPKTETTQNDWSGGEENGHTPTSSPPISDIDEKPVVQMPLTIDPIILSGGTSKPNKMMHVCPHCNFTTYMSQHMKSHLEAHERHQGQMYQCDICQMQFSQKANMHRHRMRHSGVKPYECRYCKKRFFRKDQMQEHSMTHIKTGADFDCPVSFCDLQFSQHSALRAHLDESHNITGSTPASCKRCALLFSNSRRLLLHYQTKHDEGDTSNISVKTEKKDGSESEIPIIVPPKKRRAMSSMAAPTASAASAAVPTPVITNNNNLALLQTQLENFVKKELSPANPESNDCSDHSSSPDYEQPNNYSMTNEDILMCLSNPATSSFLAMEAAMRLWTNDQLNAFGTGTPSEEQSHSPSVDSGDSAIDREEDANKETIECTFCGIVFFDRTLHLLHKLLHNEFDPWRCNLCGHSCGDKYMFTTHIISTDHSA